MAGFGEGGLVEDVLDVGDGEVVDGEAVLGRSWGVRGGEMRGREGKGFLGGFEVYDVA